GLQRAYRWLIYWLLEWRVSVFLKPGSFWSRTVRRLALAYLEEKVTDPVLRQQLTPDYDPGCKRILVSDDYFQALQDDKASLVVEPIASIEPRGIRTQDGQLHPCDALVLATGFRPFSFEENLDLVNEEGLSLSECWKDRMEAHMTVTVPKFPNLYLMLGPNSGLGHNSIIFMIEVQVRYILQCLQAQARRKLSSLVPTSAAARQYNDDLQKAMRTTVWAGSCQSWYKDSAGHNHTLWPGSTVQYWWRLRRPKLVSEYSQDGKS
ncbi:MAG: flavin-containing monooxygenase, partial [Gammaproteobacteria bacterium]